MNEPLASEGRRIANHFRSVFFGGNWTDVNLKSQLSDVDWKQATTQLESLHTIAELTFHIHYFVEAVLGVLQGKPLAASDKFSFDHPPIGNEEDWRQLREDCWSQVEAVAQLIEQLSDDALELDFADPKYKSYYFNLHGVIEHAHYHLGQIVILKRLLEP